MKKILVIDNSAILRDGDRYVCHSGIGEFSEELRNCGNSVKLFQMSLPNKGSISTFDIEEHGLQFAHVKRSKNKIISYLKLFFKGTIELFRHDFVYFYYPSSLRLLAVICAIFRKPYGLYVRGMVGIDDKISHFLYRHADIVLTGTDLFTHNIQAQTKKAVVETIKPMVDLSEDDLCRRTHIAKPTYNISFLARLDLEKGLIELLEATHRLTDNADIPDFHLNIYGDGTPTEIIRQKIKELHLNDRVTMHGRVEGKENVLAALRKADIYILPTYHEGFPRTLYEAMMSGAPIITTLVGGIPGLMKDGYNCLEIKPRSADSIEEVLGRFLTNYTDLANDLTENGYNTVLPVFDKNRPTHAAQLHRLIHRND